MKVDHLNEHSNAAASGVRPNKIGCGFCLFLFFIHFCGYKNKLFANMKVPAQLVWKLFRNSSAETLSGILDAYSRFCTDLNILHIC